MRVSLQSKLDELIYFAPRVTVDENIAGIIAIEAG